MAKPIDYIWRCRKCGTDNEPHREACTRCNFPAIAVGCKTNDDSIAAPIPADSWFIRYAGLFFPEGLLAVFVVVAAPLWGFDLLFRGHVGLAALLFASVAIGLLMFWCGHRKDSALVSWLGIVVVIGGGIGVRSLICC